MDESAGNWMDLVAVAGWGGGGLETGRGRKGPSNNHREPVDRRQEDERRW